MSFIFSVFEQFFGVFNCLNDTDQLRQLCKLQFFFLNLQGVKHGLIYNQSFFKIVTCFNVSSTKQTNS